MYATIVVSPYVQVQGLVARELASGLVAIQIAEREYVGRRLEPLRRPAFLSVV
jgi:hypothetical protein